MKRFAMWSGGKDSSASIVLCYEKGIHLDGILFAEVMFDHSRGISGENPKHIKWVYEEAIPIIEKMGYKVIIVKSKSDYMQEFHRVISNSKQDGRNGKMSGFFIGGMCAGNDRLKMRPLNKFIKDEGEVEQIVGIAVNEPERLARLKMGEKSILAEYNIREADTYDICRKYRLLSPTYEDKTRGGVLVLSQPKFKGICLVEKGISAFVGRTAKKGKREKHRLARIQVRTNLF